MKLRFGPFRKSAEPTAAAAGQDFRTSARRGAGDTMRGRLILASACFVLVYGSIIGRLVQMGVSLPQESVTLGNAQASVSAARPDILDRNGEILATDIKFASLYAEPRRVVDPDEATEQLATVFPDLGTDAVRQRLASKQGFIWLKREITPAQQAAVHALGLPGIGFLTENKRFYPSGRTVAFVTGHVNIDNQGIAGIEKYIDDQWLGDLQKAGMASTNLEPIKLSVDLRVQQVLHDEITAAMQRYTAKSSAAVVLNVKTGEVLGMTSAPDYDPMNPAEALDPNNMNRASAAVYEMGSTFKIFATSMALDSGKVKLTDSFDATQEPQHRRLHHPRLPRQAPRADRAGNLHLFVQRRHRPRGAEGRLGRPAGVPETPRPDGQGADRAAGDRPADPAQALVGPRHRHRVVRPRHLGVAAGHRHGGERGDERRHPHSRRPSSRAAKKRRA